MSHDARAAWEYAITSAPFELLKRLDTNALEVWASGLELGSFTACSMIPISRRQ